MMKNFELWKMAEEGKVNKGDVYVDQKGNELIFTGVSFQVNFTEEDTSQKYVGMTIGDNWSYSYNDLEELESQERARNYAKTLAGLSIEYQEKYGNQTHIQK